MSSSSATAGFTVSVAPNANSKLYRAYIQHRGATITTANALVTASNIAAFLWLGSLASVLVGWVTTLIAGMMLFARVAWRNEAITVTTTMGFINQDGEWTTSEQTSTMTDVSLQAWAVSADFAER